MNFLSKFSLFIFVIFLACCTYQDQNVSLKVTIENSEVDTIYISNYDYGYEKAIAVNESSVFFDTLKVKAGIYNLNCGNEYTSIYLKNGFELNITLDALEFDESISARGYGQDFTNYLFERILKREAFWQQIEDSIIKLDSNQRNESINKYKNQEIEALKSFDLDSNTLAQEIENINMRKEMLLSYIEQELALRYFAKTVKQAPNFTFKDVNGTRRALNDFKGKMLYIDVWASWCKPCIAEAPALEKLQQEYAQSNVIFLGISLDCQAEEWKEAINEHQLKGIQLITDSCWDSPFVSQYLISSIPRFFLIDQEGQFIDVDAPRPSSDEIRPLLDQNLYR